MGQWVADAALVAPQLVAAALMIAVWAIDRKASRYRRFRDRRSALARGIERDCMWALGGLSIYVAPFIALAWVPVPADLLDLAGCLALIGSIYGGVSSVSVLTGWLALRRRP